MTHNIRATVPHDDAKLSKIPAIGVMSKFLLYQSNTDKIYFDIIKFQNNLLFFRKLFAESVLNRVILPVEPKRLFLRLNLNSTAKHLVNQNARTVSEPVQHGKTDPFSAKSHAFRT